MKLMEENESCKSTTEVIQESEMDDTFSQKKIISTGRELDCKIDNDSDSKKIAAYPTPVSSPDKDEEREQQPLSNSEGEFSEILSIIPSKDAQPELSPAKDVDESSRKETDPEPAHLAVKHELHECKSECSPVKVSKTEDLLISKDKATTTKCQMKLDFSPRKSNQHRICHISNIVTRLRSRQNDSNLDQNSTGKNSYEMSQLEEPSTVVNTAHFKSEKTDIVDNFPALSQSSQPKKDGLIATKLSSPPKVTKEPTRRGGRKKKKEPVQSNTITDYFPVRRSGRQTRTQIEKESEHHILQLIKCKNEDGLEVKEFLGKGRGVAATKIFDKGDFVVEYAGELVDIEVAKEREAEYAESSNIGCYMYFFCHKSKQYCIDATAESGRLGRLINHSREGNCRTRVVMMDKQPRLILVASRTIQTGEELCYDYGDRSKASLEAHPWLRL